MNAVELSHDEILRYSRHLIMPEVAMEGQQRLKGSSVLIIGAGGLGSPLCMYLAAAGVGRIGIVDHDVVDLTNLQRQVIYSTSDVGRTKLESARETITGINPSVKVETFNTRLTSENSLEILSNYDIIVDGTDNFPTRYLVNDSCVLLGKPNVYASIFRFEGQVSIFYAKNGPCYRCLYPEPPPHGEVPSCAEGGVLGVLPGVIGLIQAIETIKLIIKKGNLLLGRLLLFDALRMHFREVKLRKDPSCPICSQNPTITKLIDYETFCGINRESLAVHDRDWEITPEELKARLGRGEPLFLLDVREPEEFKICRLPNARLIPLKQVPAHLHELDSSANIITYCKMGGRSAQALKLLRDAGFRKIKNLKGGIDAWATRVDKTMPRY